jgi:tRNA-dihydrouridine synthase A
VHARKAVLHGLSPKQNRTVPPLRYADVHRLAQAFPQLIIEINGGISSLEQVLAQLEHVDGAMIGRAAWDNPWLFSGADREVFGEASALPRRADVVAAYLVHVQEWSKPRERQPSATILLRPLLNLFVGCPGTRRWKQAVAGKCQAPERLEQLIELADALEAAASLQGLQVGRGEDAVG